MKKNSVIFSLVFILAIAVASFLIKGQKKDQVADTIFLGPKEYKATFQESAKSAKPFYDLFNKALEASNSGDQETAIKLLNESLPYVGISFEKGMVYKKLAEIYRTQNNLEKELFYIEEWPKYSMNSQLNEEAKLRAAEIRQLFAAKNQASTNQT